VHSARSAGGKGCLLCGGMEGWWVLAPGVVQLWRVMYKFIKRPTAARARRGKATRTTTATAATCCNCVFYRYARSFREKKGVGGCCICHSLCLLLFGAEMAAGVQRNMAVRATTSRIRHVAPFEVVGVYVIFILQANKNEKTGIQKTFSAEKCIQSPGINKNGTQSREKI